MNEIDYSKFKNSLERLREMHENHLAQSNTDLSVNLKEGIQESVVHRFEVCFEMLWRAVMNRLKEQGITNLPKSPKSIFRAAHENNLIEASALENFIAHTDTRVAVAYDCNMEKVERALEKVGPFIRDATELYGILTETNAER